MGFYSEIGKTLGKIVSPYRVTLFHGCAQIEGAKRIVKCTPTEIAVQTAAGSLTVRGEGVSVRLFEGEDLLLSGNITGVERA